MICCLFSATLKLQTHLRERVKLRPYSDHQVKCFCPTVSPYLTLSFSPLINIDGQLDSSRGQNPRQDCSMSPCYHRNGFRRGPPDTGERGNEFMKPGLVYFPLCLCLPLPFLPSQHPSTYIALFKLGTTQHREHIQHNHGACTSNPVHNSFNFIKTAHTHTDSKLTNKECPLKSIH